MRTEHEALLTGKRNIPVPPPPPPRDLDPGTWMCCGGYSRHAVRCRLQREAILLICVLASVALIVAEVMHRP